MSGSVHLNTESHQIPGPVGAVALLLWAGLREGGFMSATRVSVK